MMQSRRLIARFRHNGTTDTHRRKHSNAKGQGTADGSDVFLKCPASHMRRKQKGKYLWNPWSAPGVFGETLLEKNNAQKEKWPCGTFDIAWGGEFDLISSVHAWHRPPFQEGVSYGVNNPFRGSLARKTSVRDLCDDCLLCKPKYVRSTRFGIFGEEAGRGILLAHRGSLVLFRSRKFGEGLTEKSKFSVPSNDSNKNTTSQNLWERGNIRSIFSFRFFPRTGIAPRKLNADHLCKLPCAILLRSPHEQSPLDRRRATSKGGSPRPSSARWLKARWRGLDPRPCCCWPDLKINKETLRLARQRVTERWTLSRYPVFADRGI